MTNPLFRLIARLARRRNPPANRSARRRRLALERLEERDVPSVTGLVDLNALQVDSGSYSQTDIIVRFGDGATAPAGAEAIIASDNLWKVPVAAGQSVAEAVAAFQARGDVVYAEPDYTVRITTADARYGDLWGLENTGQTGGTADADVDAPEAWATTKGGSGIVVAVVDTGMDYTHEDLYLNVWINQGEIPYEALAARSGLAVDDVRAQLQGSDGLVTFYDLNQRDANGAFTFVTEGLVADANNNQRIDGGDLLAPFAGGGWADGVNDDAAANGFVDDIVGRDFHNGDSNPIDDQGHGTHVSGTIAAVENTSGVVGVAPNVRIMAVKFLDQNGSGNLSDAIPALHYAWTMGAQISNHSWGVPDNDLALQAEVQQAAANGHLMITAAGNGHWLFGYPLNNDTTAHYPSNYAPSPDTVIAVAASDPNDRLTSFSNYGATTVDLAAPGINVLSTVPKTGGFSDPSGYAYGTGTSMATPHVSGAAALVWSANPNLTAAEVKQILLSTADYIGNETYGEPTVTNGRLNVGRAVAAAAADAPGLPAASVNDVMSVSEAGTTKAWFTVSLSRAGTQVVTVDYSTADGSASAGSDYVAAAGTLMFAPGETSKRVAVTILDDAANEPNETFSLNLGNAVNATLADGAGRATVADNEPDPVYVWDIAWSAVPSGGKTNLQIKVDVNRDTNADGAPQLNDGAASGATVTLVLYNDTNGNGVYGDKRDKAWSGPATTDASGIATFNVQNAPSGNYRAEVTGLTLSGTTWAKSIDRERVSYYTGFPSGSETSGGGTAGGLTASVSPADTGVMLRPIDGGPKADYTDIVATAVAAPATRADRSGSDQGAGITVAGNFVVTADGPTAAREPARAETSSPVKSVDAAQPPALIAAPRANDLVLTTSSRPEKRGGRAAPFEDFGGFDG